MFRLRFATLNTNGFRYLRTSSKPVAAAWRATTTCLLLAGLMLAGGCSTLSDATLHMIESAVHGPPQAPAPAPAKVAALPYAQLGVTSKAVSAVLVLGYVDHGRLAWYSSNQEILFTRHGVVVKTWSLQPDILATHLPADSPFVTGLERLT
ncbi:MAG TPA: YjbF family lipoprotein, partial [Oleiagrimonas sp.]|nr:YjbF family lipoprotein [Oleiagrimonas sp.]